MQFNPKILKVTRKCVWTCLVLGAVIATAQTRDLTVDVLVNSSNTSGYNTNPASPGEYQRYPERYFENLQMPYRVIDVSNTPPPDLTGVPLIIAAHRGLNLSSAWQQAILSAVEGGVGFVNLDSDPEASMNFDTNVHNIRIDSQGSTIKVFYANALIIQVTDSTFTSGGVALDVSSQSIKYTNVRVTSF